MSGTGASSPPFGPGCRRIPATMNWPMIELIGAICGRTPSGRSPATVVSRSWTVWRAVRMSTSHPNSTYTTDSPNPDWLRTAFTPVAPSSADSSGYETSVSTSSGARPGHSVMTTTRGRSRSGNTSIGMRAARNPPYPSATRHRTTTSGR